MNKESEKKNAEISARIRNVIDFFKDTPNGFAIKLGYKRAQTVYDILSLKSAPSYDFFYRFTNAEFSDTISLDWLIAGKGPMLKSEVSKQPEVKSELHPAAPDTDLYYKMYKEEKAENRELIEEIGALKQQIRTLKIENRALSQEVEDLRTLEGLQGSYYVAESKAEMKKASVSPAKKL